LLTLDPIPVKPDLITKLEDLDPVENRVEPVQCQTVSISVPETWESDPKPPKNYALE